MNIELLNRIDGYIKQKQYRLINSIVVYENRKNNIKSIWKSILSIYTGICLDKGYIKSFDEPIANYLEEFNQNNGICYA